ncbi:MAG: hypothetical protein JNJ73_13810 [Hyphomonadaceae bacterium]|nr:hypothetical protein [Hyphomonadaceae bacterium]
MRRLAAYATALLVAGCGTAPSLPFRREALARQISDDAAAFNEAYGRAVTGQILLNILRSRDRLPRHYLSMTGIQDSPQVRWNENAGIGSIPLGEGGSPWGFGSFGIGRETLSRPSYAVQPFGADVLTRTAFQPTQPYVFAHYWESGWPRDLLVLLLVERITKVGADGAVHDFVNEANVVFDDCVSSVDTQGCAFVREARAMLSAIEAADPERRAGEGASVVCGLVGAYSPARAVKPAPPADNARCEPRLVVGDATYTLGLRSLDDVVYYIGELLRAGSMRAEGGAVAAQVNVRAAGLRGGGTGVPLFRVLSEEAAKREAPHAPDAHFTASVSYAGERYYAGPAIGRSCGAASDRGQCRDDARNGDRSSSVLSLIAELMALNQSPDAIRAPSRLIAE